MRGVAVDDDGLIQLRKQANEAADRGFPWYSGFEVIAAVETFGGDFYGGANVEVVNYSLSKHAEEVAILAAISAGVFRREGGRWLKTLYASASPCGGCRQFAWEWAVAEETVCVVEDRVKGTREVNLLRDLLVGAFDPADLSSDNLPPAAVEYRRDPPWGKTEDG